MEKKLTNRECEEEYEKRLVYTTPLPDVSASSFFCRHQKNRVLTTGSRRSRTGLYVSSFQMKCMLGKDVSIK